LAGAARIVLRDWSIGKFDRYTTPPSAPPVINTATTTLSESSLYVNDEAILSTIQTRKERRKKGGLVRFAYGSIDPRKVAVEEPWNGESSDDDDDEVDNEIDVEGMNIDGEDEDDEEEEDEEENEGSDAETGDSQEEGEEDADQEGEDENENENENELPRLSRKQKRKRGPEKSIIPSPPAKKVTFHDMPPARGSKRTDRPKKIGLLTTKIKAEGSRSKDKSGSEVYDFGKFF
jgi:nuclear GTP-binding protein